MTIDLNALAPFMLANKSQEEIQSIRDAAYAAIMSGVDHHAGLILHYATRLLNEAA